MTDTVISPTSGLRVPASTTDDIARWQEHSSGLYVPRKAKRKHPIGIDLFCGAGGFSLGFMSSGIEVIAAADYDPVCMQTYLGNLGAWPVNLVFVEPEDRDRAEKSITKSWKQSGWLGKAKDPKWLDEYGIGGLPVSGWNRHRLHTLPPDLPGVSNFFLGDIGKLTGERILRECGLEAGEVDCVFGGPPCQGFSSAGKQNVMDPRNSYVFEFCRLVLEIRPKTMCFENVPAIPDMVTPEDMPVVDAMCRILAEGDFGSYEVLKRSFLASAGVKGGAMMRGKKVPGSRSHRAFKEQAATGATQSTLFGGEV